MVEEAYLNMITLGPMVVVSCINHVKIDGIRNDLVIPIKDNIKKKILKSFNPTVLEYNISFVNPFILELSNQ